MVPVSRKQFVPAVPGENNGYELFGQPRDRKTRYGTGIPERLIVLPHDLEQTLERGNVQRQYRVLNAEVGGCSRCSPRLVELLDVHPDSERS